jgi:TonB family protein
LAWAAFLAFVAAGGAAAYRWLPGVGSTPPAEAPAEPETSPVLALKVVRQAQDLEVSWDHRSEPVRQANAGTLTIRSGPATRVIEMQPAQLREGRVVFRPLTGVDTDVRLEVLESGGRSVAESARVLGLDTATAVPLPAAPLTGAAARAAPALSSTPPGAVRKRAIRQSDDRGDSRKDTPTTAGVRQPGAVPPAPGRNDAVPIRRATPELTSDVVREMRAARNKVTVSVLMSIDATGEVDDAKVVASSGEPSPSGPYLRLASLAAARQWRFRPATADGKTVPSQMTVLFTF